MSEQFESYTDLPKILIVDDKSSSLLSMESMLEDLDVICISVSSGSDAINYVNNHDFAIILMDVQMPDMDGFETARLLKANEKTKNIPIIFNTAYNGDNQLIWQEYETGAVDFIFKPIQPAILISKIKVFLEIYNKEKELIELKNYNESIIRNFLDILIVVDNEGRIKNTSLATCKLLGYNDKELFGQSVTIIFNKNDKEKAINFFKFQSKTNTRKHLKGDDCHRNHELYCLTKDGQSIAMYFNAAKLTDNKGNKTGVVAGARDIRELKKAKEKISEEKKISESIVKNIQEGIIIVDSEGVIQFVNEGITKMLGHSKSELIGKVFGFPVIEDEFTEIDILGKKGITGIGEIRCSAIEWDGKEATFITVLDITELKKQEDKLRLLSNELQDRNIDLNSYAHTVAHDLKGPAGNIKNFADLLYTQYEKLSKEELKKYLSVIYNTSSSLFGIINELLLFSSLQKTEITTTNLDMRVIVEKALQSLDHMKEKVKHEIIFPKSFLSSIGYAPWVEEVWKNYISNAYKYTQENSIIEFGSEQQIDKIKYWIKDNGPGISKKNQRLLFKKFERLDNAHATGYGLGLAIVKRIVAKLGGKTGVESELGKGSLFYFTLPATLPSQSKVAQTFEEKTSSLPYLNTLIVEDDMISDLYIDIVTQKFSKKILHVKTGNDAIKACRENPDIDLILMDVGLPDINGYETTKKIREFNKKVIIIAQTAFTLTNDREQALEAGCNEYIAKPINTKELNEIIKRHLPNNANSN